MMGKRYNLDINRKKEYSNKISRQEEIYYISHHARRTVTAVYLDSTGNIKGVPFFGNHHYALFKGGVRRGGKGDARYVFDVLRQEKGFPIQIPFSRFPHSAVTFF